MLHAVTKFALAVAAVAACRLGGVACPVLQPGVKDYRAEAGAASYSAASVV